MHQHGGLLLLHMHRRRSTCGRRKNLQYVDGCSVCSCTSCVLFVLSITFFVLIGRPSVGFCNKSFFKRIVFPPKSFSDWYFLILMKTKQIACTLLANPYENLSNSSRLKNWNCPFLQFSVVRLNLLQVDLFQFLSLLLKSCRYHLATGYLLFCAAREIKQSNFFLQ